ncbi:hypothetical protein EDC01DRAFT_461521 [Geopyxis carbonaria]|nr:hypothetical protein EDC01DRAFT_461521 [Geopyxis carbonaria]
MFRALSRQAFIKAVPRPIFRLSNGATSSRWIHGAGLPFTGPPSYDTIARRFSGDVDPQAYFARQRQEDRGEYVDIHDIGGIDPEDFDVLISDVDDARLRTEVAEVVGIPYHAQAIMKEANRAVTIGDCYLSGKKLRTIFPTVVARGARAHWVFFIVDSASPLTYLSAQTSDLFDIREDRVGPAGVKIAGYAHAVHRSPSHSHFTEVNLLGMDFFNLQNVSQVNDFEKGRARLLFGTDWEIAKKPKL